MAEGGTMPARPRGFVADEFSSVADVFAAEASRSHELGAGVCISVEGEVVADLAWGATHAGEWQVDTLVPILSSSKAIVALVAMLLVDRRVLDVDERVAAYWPEFAQNGKDRVLVRHILSHTSGVLSFAGYGSFAGPSNRRLVDYDAIARALEGATPYWSPGSQSGYHALTFGWIMNELVRRIAGHTVGELFRDEFANRSTLDVFPSVTADLGREVTPILPSASGDLPVLDERGRATQFLPDGRDDAEQWVCEVANDTYIQAHELPGVSAVATASGLCGMYTPLANDGSSGGIRIVGDSTIERFATPGRLPDGSRHGYGLGFTVFPLLDPPSGREAFGHSGAGGARGLADPGRRLAYGYVKNQLHSAQPSLAVLAATCRVIDGA
jgi:CubicO group peptidase (beta-lactamase class C family)